MVYYSRRDGIHVEIRHLISPDHHRTFLPAEGCDYLCQCIRTAINIVTVELDRKFSACIIVDSKIPAAADAQVVSCRYKVDQSLVLDFFQKLRCSVCGMIVHDYDIERKIAFLAQGALYCVSYGSDAVEDGDYHGRRNLPANRYFVISTNRFFVIPTDRREWRDLHILEHRRQPRPDTLKILRAYPLHLYLHLTVLRVHIVELFLPRFPVVGLNLRVEIFIHMHDILHSKTQVIQRTPQVIFRHGADSPAERRGPEYKDATEIEIVPQRSRLAIYQRMFQASAIRHLIMVSIKHIRPRIFGDAYHTVQRQHSHFQRSIFHIYENIFLRHCLGNAPEGLGRLQRHP